MSEAHSPAERQPEFVSASPVYQEFLAEREEILRHKWIESERAGHDIGFERALLDWIRKHRDDWRKSRRQPSKSSGAGRCGPSATGGDFAASQSGGN